MLSPAKLNSIASLITSFDKVLLALSGGVDSSVLLKLAADCLGPDQVLAVTIRSETTNPREFAMAAQIAQTCRVAHEVVTATDLTVPEFAANSPDRCYYCKLNHFRLLRALADTRGYRVVVDGSNWSDQADYRPGMRALNELGIRSPLRECGFTKAEIRQLAKGFGLPNWQQPANACLSSRFPYGTPITAKALAQVAQGEKLLLSFGLTQCRLRHHGSMARIEVLPEEFPLLFDPAHREAIITGIKQLGYAYVTLDLQGYRTGSLNEVIISS